jgi:hypothetical protein
MDPQEAAEPPPASPTSPSTPISPPFWHSEGQEPLPAATSAARPAGGIQLEDHTHEDSERSKACWARSVAVRDHVVVGSGLGAYVVYNCVVETANVGAPLAVMGGMADVRQGSDITVRKRCGSRDRPLTRAHRSKVLGIRHAEGPPAPHVPQLGGGAAQAPAEINLWSARRAVVNASDLAVRFERRFLEKRRQGLQYFLKYVRSIRGGR